MFFPPKAVERAMQIKTDEPHLRGPAGQRAPCRGSKHDDQANACLRAHYIGRHNELLAREPQNPQSAFAPVSQAVLHDLLCVESVRMVGKDKVVTMEALPCRSDDRLVVPRVRASMSSCVATSISLVGVVRDRFSNACNAQTPFSKRAM